MHFELRQLALTIWNKRSWVIAPAVTLALLALVYAVFKKDQWTSTQSLYIRNEALGQVVPLGRFESVHQMQTAQETIFELAQQPAVLREALWQVGPAKKISNAQKRNAWPSDKVVEEFRKSVRISAPKGAQLGRTEMIYLTVKAETVARSTALAAAVTDSLISHLRQLRQQKYQGVIDELCDSVAMAQTDLEKAMLRLSALDQKLGSDIVEMRVINNSSQGDGSLRRTLGEIRNELRVARSDYARKQLARDQLMAVREDPNKLISLPNELLASHPGLSRLKDGLVDAQVASAKLSGEMNPEHPRVQAALLAERKIHERLFREIQLAIDSSDAELQLATAKIEDLTQYVDAYEDRFADLSEVRSHYNRLTKEVEFKQSIVERLESDLAVARANLATAASASLIQKVDSPVPATRAVGPGRKTIVLAGLLGGALLGLGVIWLIEPVRMVVDRRSAAVRGRRATDQILVNPAKVTGNNEGASPTVAGRRLEDHLQALKFPQQGKPI